MKLFPAFLIISITLALSSCGAKNDKAVPVDSSISSEQPKNSGQRTSGGIRGLFVCQNPDKEGAHYPNLEFRSDDMAMIVGEQASKDEYRLPLHFTREGNFIYFKDVGDAGFGALFIIFVPSIKIVSPNRLEQDVSSDPYVWVKKQ
jgi:hypothetical protein